MIRKRKVVVAAVAGGIALVLLPVVMQFFGATEIAHESVSYSLNAIGQAIYEFHTTTGQWPSQPEDLNRTSLTLHLRYWRPVLDNGSIVVVWHDNLQPHPQENANVILAYHNRGLLAELGRQWVCWGDLRTEYISSRRLKTVLQQNPK